MPKKPFIYFLFLSGLMLASCHHATPAGFWKTFMQNRLVIYNSNQGPYGGHSAIYWKSNNSNEFTPTNVLAFAKQNGWAHTSSSAYNGEQTNQWIYDGKAVFPLTNKGFTETMEHNTQVANFPRWFGGQITVFKFKTGWVTIAPGTDDSIEENGFVVINSTGTAMAVYHLWGE